MAEPEYQRGDGEVAHNTVEFYFNPITEKDHIRIIQYHDRNFVYDQPVEPYQQTMYADQWERYKSGAEQFAGHTRLSEVPWIDPAARRMMEALNVFTVEMLAEFQTSDTRILNQIGGDHLINKAKKFVEEKTAASESAAKDEQIAALEARLAALESAPAKRGRPAKQEREQAAA